MSVWSFCPTAIKDHLSTMTIKNKGDINDINEYRRLWVDWIGPFKGCEQKAEWAICNGIHDALISQIAFKSKKFDTFYIFDTDYKFYDAMLLSYNYKTISPKDIKDIKPNSYVIVSQPNHEGKITPWFEELKEHCRNNNSRIFLDCAFYGTTLNDSIDTSDPVFDAVAFSLSKNFMLGGTRAGIVFGDKLAFTLTVPINKAFGYSYFNSLAVEAAKTILPNFPATYITEHAKKHQIDYCNKNNLTPADIWMWAFDKDNNKICITNFIKDDIQKDLDKV